MGETMVVLLVSLMDVCLVEMTVDNLGLLSVVMMVGQLVGEMVVLKVAEWAELKVG